MNEASAGAGPLSSGESILAHLLAPESPAAFFADRWGKAWLHLRRASPSCYDNILRLADIDLLLQSEHLPAAFVNAISNGVPHPLEEWSRLESAARGEARVVVRERLLALYRSGATIILNQLYRSVPRLTGVCAGLARHLGFPVRANAYVTPPGAQGFARHSDDHEIFILQIGGSKSFVLYAAGSPPEEVRLDVGDLLYIPRGLPHEARTSAEASVHLSMGLYPIYAFDLLQELAAAAKDDPAFQSLVPAAANDAYAAFAEHFVLSLGRLTSSLPVEALIDRRAKVLAARFISGSEGRFTDVVRAPEILLDTIVARRPGVLLAIDEQGPDLRVRFAGAEIAVATFLRGALDQLLDGHAHRVRSMRALLPESAKVSLARQLVEAGVLTIVTLSEDEALG